MPLVLLPLLALLAQEPHRPAYHFTPARNWMNDPNGTIFFEGEYHLFYQHNPFGNKWGHMSWGHAVSKDLIEWQHLPVAIPEENGIAIFSGSAVADRNNTSGLCDKAPCLIAIYTGHTSTNQNQNLAVSNDRGRTWHKYEHNPVLDIGRKDFRDPKVFWHAPSRAWIMALALPTDHKVRFYSSPNLKQWTLLSDFGPAGATSGIWECPDLFPLTLNGKTHWVLIVSINPGGPAGGSAVQYFIGDFDGRSFRSTAGKQPLWADFGKDFYAATSFTDAPANRRIWIGWSSNWQYANDEPTTPWRTIQSIPRELSLRQTPAGLRLIQQPVRELARHRHSPLTLSNLTIEEANRRLKDFHSQSFEFELDLDGPGGLQLLKGDAEQTLIGVNEAGETYIDRTRSGNTSFHKDFPGRHSTPATFPLRVLVDRTTVEVFAQTATISDRVFPSDSSDGVQLFGEPGTRLRTLRIWSLTNPMPK